MKRPCVWGAVTRCLVTVLALTVMCGCGEGNGGSPQISGVAAWTGTRVAAVLRGTGEVVVVAWRAVRGEGTDGQQHDFLDALAQGGVTVRSVEWMDPDESWLSAESLDGIPRMPLPAYLRIVDSSPGVDAVVSLVGPPSVKRLEELPESPPLILGVNFQTDRAKARRMVDSGRVLMVVVPRIPDPSATLVSTSSANFEDIFEVITGGHDN